MARGWSRSAIGALVAAAAAALVWAVAFRTAAGAEADRAVLADVLAMGEPSTRAAASRIAHLADPRPVALFTVMVAALALARRRPREALLVLAVLAGANVTTQALKWLTAEPRPVDAVAGAHVASASWPSGHATAAMTIALCLIVVAPSRQRAIAAVLGCSGAVAVGYSVVLLGWHLPSDVLGGFLVAAAWTSAGYAILSATGSLVFPPQDAQEPSLGPPVGRRAGDPRDGVTRPGGESPHRAA